MHPRHDPGAVGRDAAAAVAAYLARLQRRARGAVVAESALAGAVGLFGGSLALQAVELPGPLRAALLAALAVAAATGWLLLRRRRWQPARVAARAEAGGAFRNMLITALELDAHPERATARIRARVAREAATASARVAPSSLWPAGRLAAIAGAAALVGAAGVLIAGGGADPGRTASAGRAGVAAATGPPVIDRVDVTVTPPGYTGLPPAATRDAGRIDAIAGSRVAVHIASRAPRVEIGAAGRTIALERGRDGAFTFELDARETTLLAVTALDAGGGRRDGRAMVLAVREDSPPEVAIRQPGADLVATSAGERVLMGAEATDDLGLASLSLHYTRVTGSGEQFAFTEGELPWTVTRDSSRAWRSQTRQALAALGLAAGDVLVYYAKARDRRPGAPAVLSDSFVIEIGQPQQAVSGGFAIPPEADRHGLSLSALIEKTERLHARRGRMAAAAFADAAGGLAVEQRMVRTEVLFLMGAHGHVDDEVAEAGESNEIQEGRLENRGQAELRAATRLMTTAERHLVAADTGAALIDQRRALAVLQRALSRQRYFLRTLAVRSQIDLGRRLTGDLSEARSWTRGVAGAPDPTRTAEVRGILRGLQSGAAADLAALAARLLALDPASEPLQAAARALAQAGRADPAARSRARDQAARAALARLPPMAPTPHVPATPARRLVEGAWIDALDAERRP